LDRWSEKLGQTNLAAGGLPAAALRPVQIDADDVADGTAYRSANVWSKVLPVLLLIWALTGAFYPAVDLCAGEKERGTLETLLSSPAERGEIVLGKLLTVMLFSAATSALNLASLAVTGCVALGHAAGFSPPPLAGVIWLAVALLPVSALFAALCLALAAMARSTKEGQYYLMPLLLVTLPLTLLPMTPGVELGLGNSLIPITGLVLLLRSALEGSAWQALPFLPTVLAVTLTACWLALRWAIEQFNSESVLFRQGERFNLGLWLRGLLSQRQPTPGVGGAIFCGLAILLVKFFLGAAAAAPAGLAGFARLAVVTQLAVILTPALLMTIILSGSPRQTLLLRLPRWPAIPAAVALAVAVHPLTMALQTAVRQLYPLSEEMRRSLSDVQAMFAAASGWQLVFVLALVPALCEELAFRGFILSGLRQRNRPWRAIVWTAILFGLVHGVLQQSIIACMLGLVLGYLAVQTGSILPPILFHFAHNALVVATTRVTPDVPQRWPALAWLVKSAGEDGIVYHPAVCLLACLAAAALLAWFGRLRPVVLPAEVLAAVGPAADKPAECCV
jgi:sodium transport system permease protein